MHLGFGGMTVAPKTDLKTFSEEVFGRLVFCFYLSSLFLDLFLK